MSPPSSSPGQDQPGQDQPGEDQTDPEVGGNNPGSFINNGGAAGSGATADDRHMDSLEDPFD
jgi:hypothetical protein